jgi:hypothetical protein
VEWLGPHVRLVVAAAVGVLVFWIVLGSAAFVSGDTPGPVVAGFAALGAVVAAILVERHAPPHL